VTLNRAVPARKAPTRRLASWRPATMREWPGHIATSLRLWGCTFACPECASAALRRPVEGTVDWTDVIAHVDAHRDMLEGIVVTGGEPTEDPDLPSLLAALKELDLPVRLDTNGARPDVLAHLVAEALVDSVALDIKTVPACYRLVSPERDMPARVAECVDMLVESGMDHEFRTTLVPGLVAPADVPSIARTLRGGRVYALQQFVPTRPTALAPYPDTLLSAAAAECRRFLPTIVRGLDIGED
jgi:pyruvate formate lyase activating enzyme